MDIQPRAVLMNRANFLWPKRADLVLTIELFGA